MQIHDLIADLRLAAPGAPEPFLIEQYLRSVRRFCRETSAWREEIGVTLVAGTTNEYSPNAPAGAEAYDARSVMLGERSLYKASREQMRRRFSRGSVVQAFRVAAGKLHLAPDPGDDVSSALTMVALLRPLRTAQEIPDELVDEHHDEAFLFGAYANILVVPNKEWTDLDLASYYAKRYRAAIDEWRSRGADEGMVGLPRRVKYGGY